MAGRGNPSFLKNQKAKKRQERANEKRAARQQRNADKAAARARGEAGLDGTEIAPLDGSESPDSVEETPRNEEA
jgi:hypothetical protein